MEDEIHENGGNTATLRRPAWLNPLPQKRMEALEHQAEELNERARAFIRQNPVAVVCGAVAIGFLVGRLLVRR